jgi:hypothetical protein
MENRSPSEPQIEPNEKGWPLYEVWKQYEDIAMHFNDLLMRLRTQALAAIAALATIIGIFAKINGSNTDWESVTIAFTILVFFWIAIWVLDFCYYNRLLLGAAVALFNIEEISKKELRIRHLEMSTMIRDAVAGKLDDVIFQWSLNRGRWIFYGLVCVGLLIGLSYSGYEWLGKINCF